MCASKTLEFEYAHLFHVLLFRRWVQPKRVMEALDLRVLAMIGAALGVARAIQTSHLDQDIASLVSSANASPTALYANHPHASVVAANEPCHRLFLTFFVTMALTEIVTNNAVAAICLPMALRIADDAGLSYKPFAMAVLFASQCAFSTPIGYQTST